MHELAPDRSSERPLKPTDRQALAEDLLDAAFNAWRQGALPALVMGRPRAARWMLRRLHPLVESTLGTDGAGDLATECAWLLHWAVIQLRPDQVQGLEDIPDQAWLHQPAWRPMLSVACQMRLLQVRDFPQRYRRAANESAAANLCGLWNVETSTFYRYLERGQREMLRLAQEPPPAHRRLALRSFLARALFREMRCSSAEDQARWHQGRVEESLRRADAPSALWHALEAGCTDRALEVLTKHASVMADHPECDVLVERLSAMAPSSESQSALWIARAALARSRQLPEREEFSALQALRLAEVQGDDLMRAEALCALARCFETSDVDRACAYYEDAKHWLHGKEVAARGDRHASIKLTALTRLAFLRVGQNQPSARLLLDEATALRDACGSPEELAGLLDQAWAVYWRFANEPERALESRLRALTMFERAGNLRSVLTTYSNLMASYADMHDLERVESYAEKVFAAARRHAVEPGIVIGAYGNLGYAYGVAGHYEQAASHYLKALELARRARHDRFVMATHYNLANAYYQLFLSSQDRQWESLGDEHVNHVLLAPSAATTPALRERARALKAEVLGLQPEASIDRLLDDESSLHLAEMSEIKRQRLALAAGDAAAQVTARLAVTRAYLTIAAKERDAAREQIAREGLHGRFGAEVDALRQTFERNLSREQALAADWKQQAADVLDDTRRQALLAHLHAEGAVNKSGYAALAGVAPATASKHLVMLAERGLLLQRGKGPSTRYELPD